MSKLRLNVSELQVETFTVAREMASRGTVRANAEATYGCTAGWAGCAAETIGETCDALCSDTNGGFSCDYMTCSPLSCGGIEQSCQTEGMCQSFSPCTGDACSRMTACN